MDGSVLNMKARLGHRGLSRRCEMGKDDSCDIELESEEDGVVRARDGRSGNPSTAQRDAPSPPAGGPGGTPP